MSSSSAASPSVLLDEFGIGLQAYADLHRRVEEILDPKSSNKDLDVTQITNSIRTTGVKEYLTSVTEYEKDVNKVAGEFKEKLEAFRGLVKKTYIGRRAEKTVKELESDWANLGKRPSENMDDKNKYLDRLKNLRKLLGVSLSSSSMDSERLTVKEAWRQMFGKEDPIWSKLDERLKTIHTEINQEKRLSGGSGGHEYKKQLSKKGGTPLERLLEEEKKKQKQHQAPKGKKLNEEQVDKVLELFRSLVNESDLGQEVSSKIKNMLEFVEEAQKRTPESEKSKPSEINIDTYIKWYEAGKLDGVEDAETSREIFSLLPKLQVTWLYRSIQKHPLMGFVKFVENHTHQMLNWGNKNKNDKNFGSVATKVVSLAQEVQKMTNSFPSNLSDVSVSEANKNRDQIAKFRKTASDLFIKVSEAITASGAKSVPRAKEKLTAPSKQQKSSADTGASSSSRTQGDGYDRYDSKAYGDDDDDDKDDAGRLGRPHTGPIVKALFMRSISLNAVKVYNRQLSEFHIKVKDDIDPEQSVRETVLKRANDALERSAERLKELDDRRSSPEPDLARIRYDQKQVTDYKVKIMKQMMSQLKTRFDQYMRVHADFLMRQHRDGIQYMIYWRNVSVDNEKARELIKGYFENVRSIKAEVDVHIKAMKAAYKEAMRGDGEFKGINSWNDAVPEDDRKEIIDLQRDVNEFADDTRQRIFDMYDGDGMRLRDRLLDSHLILMYGVKLARFLFVWASLQFSERMFQLWYAKAVYGDNAEPPHPVKMLLLAVGIEALLNLVMVAILLLLRAMFSANNTRFPINSLFLKAYAVDYLCSTVVLFVISALIAEVMRKKKYFRYRYEGDRGIRALRTMVFYIAMIVILLPFFRISS